MTTNVNTNMTKRGVVLSVAEQLGISSAQATLSVDAFLEALARAFSAGQEVHFRGFGVFRVKEMPERRVVTGLTTEPVIKPAHKKVSFKMHEALRERL